MKKRKQGPVRKRGRYSREDVEYVLLNRDRMSVEAIADRLGRKVSTVREILSRHDSSTVPPDQAEAVTYRVELRNSERWLRVQEELTPAEMRYFEQEYVALRQQYHEDVLPTEETQIFDLIRFNVLKSRNMVERRRAREMVDRLSRERERVLEEVGGDWTRLDAETRAALGRLDAEIKVREGVEKDRIAEYMKLQERYDTLMKALKSTREQRIKDIETGKETVLGLIKNLQREEFRRTEGRQAELMKMAGEREYRRLGMLHEYDDGQVDRPILSPETVE